ESLKMSRMTLPLLKRTLARAPSGARSVSELPAPVPSNNSLLVAQNLEVSYGATQVLWGVSFAVTRGKVTCIIGSNGAGKTTALNTIAGVLQAKKGRLLLNGDDISSSSTRER